MQKRSFGINPVLRSVGVMSAVAVLVGGVTFAALQSRATLTDNTISSASANLLVDGNKDGTFSEEEPGFAFKDIVPGVTPSEAQQFALQNNGDTDLKIRASVVYNGTAEPEAPEAMTNNNSEQPDPTVPELPEGVEASDIEFTFTPEGGEAVTVTWEELVAKRGKKVLATLPAGASQNMTVQVSIKSSASASSIEIGSFDIVFIGKAVSAPGEPEQPAEEPAVNSLRQ